LVYSAKVAKNPCAERNRRIQEALELFSLKTMRSIYRQQFSGGQRQRVAIGAKFGGTEPDRGVV